jgi:hypothetical protein
MKKSISSRINMYVVTLDTCKQHEGEWAGIPKMVSAVNDFENRLNELRAIAVSHSTKTIGVSNYKNEKLAQLYESLEEVHGAYRALALVTKDSGLRIRNSISNSSLLRMDAVKLVTHIQSVAEDLIQTGTQLEPFGIDSNRLGEILQLIEESEAIISKPRKAIVERKTLTSNLSEKAQEIDTIVKELIDNIVRLMKHSSPDFFKDYFAARKIIKTGVRHNDPVSGLDSSGLASAPTEPDDGN